MSYGGRSERSVTTLYVNGFGPEIRARELAFEFERFGRLVRCDIPAPKNPQARPFAFVEYEDRRDAADAYDQMHKMTIGRDVISVEYAKNTPSTGWRSEQGDSRGPPRRYDDRGPPPRRYDEREPPRAYADRGPPRDYAYRGASREYDDRRAPRGRSASPARGSRSGGSVSNRSPVTERADPRERSPMVDRRATPPAEEDGEPIKAESQHEQHEEAEPRPLDD